MNGVRGAVRYGPCQTVSECQVPLRLSIMCFIEPLFMSHQVDGSTLNVGTISGGTKFNIIADRATAEVNIRAWTVNRTYSPLPAHF